MSGLLVIEIVGARFSDLMAGTGSFLCRSRDFSRLAKHRAVIRSNCCGLFVGDVVLTGAYAGLHEIAPIPAKMLHALQIF